MVPARGWLSRLYVVRHHPIQTLLESCKSWEHLKQIHAHITRTDPFLRRSSAASLLAAAYACSLHGNLIYAKSLFYQLHQPSLFSWNSIIQGLSTRGDPHEAVGFYGRLLRLGPRPNNYTFPAVIRAYSKIGSLRCGVAIHAHVLMLGVEKDPFVQSALVRFYAEEKLLVEAQRVFEMCLTWDVAVANCMIDAFMERGETDLARNVFEHMESRDVVSWNTMIKGYSLVGDLGRARKLFEIMPDRNLVSWNSMLACHAKCGDVDGARNIFLNMPQKDVVSWNSLLACYVQNGQCSEAVELFDQMCCRNLKPTEATMVCLLSVCSQLGDLERGERLHAYIDSHGMVINTILGTALMDMYAKCGKISCAIQIFQSLKQKDFLAYNTMIVAMAVHGNVSNALKLFHEMTVSGIEPDDITFVGLLSGCAHSGMVYKGQQILSSMIIRYGIKPKAEHYGCLVDLMSRAGMLEKALHFLKTVPHEAHVVSLGAFVSGCGIQMNLDLGEGIGEQLLQMQPRHSGRYALLSSLYATADRWDNAGRVRTLMTAKGVAKVPGTSIIQLQ